MFTSQFRQTVINFLNNIVFVFVACVFSSPFFLLQDENAVKSIKIASKVIKKRFKKKSPFIFMIRKFIITGRLSKVNIFF